MKKQTTITAVLPLTAFLALAVACSGQDGDDTGSPATGGTAGSAAAGSGATGGTAFDGGPGSGGEAAGSGGNAGDGAAASDADTGTAAACDPNDLYGDGPTTGFDSNQPDILNRQEFTDGDDYITSPADWGAFRLEYRFGEVNSGKGNDTIIGTTVPDVANSGSIGILVVPGNEIRAGSGDDTFEINLEREGRAIFVQSGAKIDMGTGADVIHVVDGKGNIDIVGTLDMGGGDDTIVGKLDGSGGQILGGGGVDTILLPQGSYSTNSGGIGGFEMTGFERVGGINGGLFELGSGTVSVNAAGVATSGNLTEIVDP